MPSNLIRFPKSILVGIIIIDILEIAVDLTAIFLRPFASVMNYPNNTSKIILTLRVIVRRLSEIEFFLFIGFQSQLRYSRLSVFFKVPQRKR